MAEAIALLERLIREFSPLLINLCQDILEASQAVNTRAIL